MSDFIRQNAIDIMIADTSLQAYKDIRDKLGEKQLTVLEAIKSHPDSTNFRLAKILGWEINRVTGRVNELAGLGYIEQSGIVRDINERPAKTWRYKQRGHNYMFPLFPQNTEQPNITETTETSSPRSTIKYKVNWLTRAGKTESRVTSSLKEADRIVSFLAKNHIIAEKIAILTRG